MQPFFVPALNATALPVTKARPAGIIVGPRNAVASEAALARAVDPICTFGVSATFDATELRIAAADRTA